MNNTMELSWAAGFFDGEGHIRAQRRSDCNGCQLAVKVSQIDRRVLDRFAAAVGVGVVYGPMDGGGRVPQWEFNTSSFEKGQQVVVALWQFLSPVKREQARQALLDMRSARPGPRTRNAAGQFEAAV